MQKSAGGLLYSASDLVNFAACAHLSHLDLMHLQTPMPKAQDSDEMVLIQQKGFAHEAGYVQVLRDQYGEVIDLKADESNTQAFERTCQALRQHQKPLFQATFLQAPWLGHADFLIPVPTPSKLGDYSFEVVDTKLARTSRSKFLVQLCLYSEMLADIQDVIPKQMHVVLGDGRKESFNVADYLRYYRQLKERFLDWVQGERQSYPERCDRCDMCAWREICKDRWEADDHLNRVAGITKLQIPKLQKAGVGTMKALAVLPQDSAVAGMQPDTVEKLTAQARLQLHTLETKQPVFEYLTRFYGKGFERLPASDPGDLYFDMEGDPLEDGGLEYLFGLNFDSHGQRVFKPFWAHSRAEEKKAFEAFIDFVIAHLQQWPHAHIYHYAPYEPTALKRLMSLHATREVEVDELLRAKKFVDLYAVVRESIRVGEPSYSIKSIERFYRQARSGDVKTAGASIVYYEQWKTTQDNALLQAIEEYNKEDVISTYELHHWLMQIASQQPEGDPENLKPIESKPERPQSEASIEEQAQLEIYRQVLTQNLPDDPLTWSEDERVRKLLFEMLSFHKRANKPAWWALFARAVALEEELLDDVEAIAGMTAITPPKQLGPDSWQCAYAYPEQEFKLKSGDDVILARTGWGVSELEIDEDGKLVKFKCKGPEPVHAGLSIGKGGPLSVKGIVAAYKRFVDAYLAGDQTYQAGLDLLYRRAPRVQGIEPGQPLLKSDDLLAETIRTVKELEHSCLFIQGPPGAGKTYTGSHVITELIRSGKRIAVTSNSHKAINNLLQGVEKVAEQQGLTFTGYKASSNIEQHLKGKFIKDTTTPLIKKGHSNASLIAGTAWLLSDEKLTQQFDYLFVDEAGQVSLANLIAMSTCAKNIVLLGDQMQLGQPIQGVHPGESGLSTLDYLLSGAPTIAPDKGIFLKDTWRMHPDVCRFISDAVYEGRLQAQSKNSNQRLHIQPGKSSVLKASGISFFEMDHQGCSQRSLKEAEVIRGLFNELLTLTYTDRDGLEHPVGVHNVLVVAPYNQQVNLIKRYLPDEARVGTVDKFQGQEAEVVLISMTTSSGKYLPRNIEFLYSKNRLNVAISRARTLAVLIANPALMQVSCNTPEQMALVNTLCWLHEYASA